MPREASVWFFVVDGGKARLLEGTRVPPGRIHVAEHAHLDNENESHERGRPSPRTGKGGTYASVGHEEESQLHRFAKEVVAWVEREASERHIDHVPLFSAPRFLGELRKLYPPSLARRVREHHADLTHLTTAALSKHPAVAELLEFPRG
jgi:protein required for attachment to host cells